MKLNRKIISILLCLLLFFILVGCGNNENVEDDVLTDLSKLTKAEMEVYDEYLFTYKERDLKGLSPLTICRFYLLSQTRKLDDRETMWNLLDKETAPPNSTKYIDADPDDELIQYIDEELYTDVEDVQEEIKGDTAFVRWKAVKDSKTYSIKLIKATDKLTGDEVWKIVYPPLQ